MPTLNWIGKEAVVKHHRDVPYRLLEPVKKLSCGGQDSGNLIVQGDNLHALKALLPRYAGQVKCIYIDPPYNTGMDRRDDEGYLTGWVYSDRVNSPEIKGWLDSVVGSEAEDLCRHDKWLCMMYPRLVLLKQFLRSDGVIFISIDETEVSNLMSIMDEIFGRSRRLATFTWIRKKKGSNLSKEFRKITEYVVAYKGTPEKVELHGVPAYSEKLVPLLNRSNSVSMLSFAPMVLLAGRGLSDGKISKGVKAKDKGELQVTLLDDIEIKDHVVQNTARIEGRWRWSQEFVDYEVESGSKFFLSKDFRINVIRHDQSKKSKSPRSLLSPEDGIGTNEDASEELRHIFPERDRLPFDYPKPSSLVHYLVRSVCKEEPSALVLDSFSGSGTTAHAVLKQNAEDGGNRRFILVEMEEKVAREVTAERVRRVAKGYRNRKREKVDGLGGGFQFCKLSEQPLFDATGAIQDDIGFDKLAEFVWFKETGVGFPGKVKSPLLGVYEGRAVYLLFNGILKDRSVDGGNVLTGPVLEALPSHDGSKVIYAAACRLGEPRLRRERIVFRQTPYALEG